MSTQYEIADDEAGVILEFSEESGRISIGIVKENSEDMIWSEAVFDSDHLIQICIKILSVASYIDEDSESVRSRFNKAVEKDYYLGSMKP